MVFGIVIAASMLALVFRGFGGDRTVTALMGALPGGELTPVLIVMLVVFLLGFILDAVEIIYIVMPLLGPAVLMGDVSPVWFAVLLAMNLQTSFLTPPFGFALFYFRSVAPRRHRHGRDLSRCATLRGCCSWARWRF
jgi:TRAP-type mannitol/chloroaromatic compound transport system permease large subunit